MKKSSKRKNKKILLILCNIFFILITIISSIAISFNVESEQKNNNLSKFTSNIESMKKVTQTYINSETGYLKNWAAYINKNNFTEDEALFFLRTINTNSNRISHIIDIDDFSARTTYIKNNVDTIQTYKKYFGNNLAEYEQEFHDNILKMYNNTSNQLCILGKYRIDETLAQVISLGTKISLKINQNEFKNYLLLRIIPVSDIQNTWIFPIDYKNAEVGLITNAGDYVIQSNSMKSNSFIEYIRSYNYEQNSSKVEDFRIDLMTNNTGLYQFKNFRDISCIWYFSSFGENTDINILGVIYESELYTNYNNYYITILIGVTLFILITIDSLYIYNINKKLKESVLTAENANKSKTIFLSSMSHDIRTPLNAIIGLNYLAKKNIDNKEYLKDCLNKSENASQQLLTLINDILDISKIESGKINFNNESINLMKFMDNINSIVEPQAKQKNITFSYHSQNILFPNIISDKSKLEQICLNLLSNSIKYTNNNGEINFEISEQQNNDMNYVDLIFKISDNGIGMSEEYQKQMYQIFSREINTRVNKTQGTGLGLSIVKQIIDAMNGKITCNSQKNLGTNFIIELKVQKETFNSLKKEEIINSNKIKSLNILIAEDNDINSQIIVDILQEYNVHSTRVCNGQECLNILKNNRNFSAIIMDVHMPIMDGIEATKEIRRLGVKIPIIAMTADAFKDNIQDCFNAGMNYHITKPININKLLEILNKLGD